MRTISQNLVELKEGIIVPPPHGKLIWEGKQELIIKSKFHKKKINKLLYVIEDSLCYGVIKLNCPNKISLKEFSDTSDKHLFSDDERSKWWKNKEVLFSYSFVNVAMFEEPREIKINMIESPTFITDFDFVDVEEQLIKDISSYNTKKVSNKQLADDWRIVMAWYSTKKSGGNIKHSTEEIINLAGIIYREIIDRVGAGKMKHDFKPKKMTGLSRELFNIVSKGKTGIKKNSQVDLGDPKILDEFGDKTIIKDFISVIGSVAEKKGNPNDIDLLIRMGDPPKFIKRAVETRISKDLDFSDKIHFVWGDPEGPHDSFIPLYDLKLSKIKQLKRVKMQEEPLSREMSELSPIEPMKPGKRFYRPDKIMDYMFKNDGKFAMEKKYNGFRAILIKEGDKVKIFSDQKKDISKNFPSIRGEATQLSSKDFILDGELVYKEGNRSDLIKFIVGKEKITDEKVDFLAFDCIYLGKDITDSPWNERKQQLHSLNFTEHIKEVNSIIVSKKKDAEKALKLLRNLNESEGAIIKKYDGKYKKGAESTNWVKFRNEDTIVAKVIDIKKSDGTYVYEVGIELDKDDINRFNEKYLDNSNLILGNTFVTGKKLNKGDNLVVNVEEIWKHKYTKNKNTIRFSIHKPRVMEKTKKPTSSWRDLDNIAVSKGEEVIENSGATTTKTKDVKEVSATQDGEEVISQDSQGEEDSEYEEWDKNKELSEKFNPPKAAKKNAQKVIDWREEHGDEVKGMTRVGWTRASQLASGKPISADIVKRMAQFNRHRKNAKINPKYKDTPWKDAGHVAWLGWGGDEGIDWAIRTSKKLENQNNTEENSESKIDNHDLFSKWSDDMAYFLGLLSTDGNLDKETNRIEFYMSKEDSKILTDLCKLLGGSIKPKDISGNVALRFKSDKMSNDLIKLGLGVKKKDRKTHEKVPDKYKWAFARGSFDGDGSVSKNMLQYSNNNVSLVKWMKQLFDKVVDNIKYYNYDNMHRIVVTGEDSIKKIHSKIYAGKGPMFSRKAEKNTSENSDTTTTSPGVAGVQGKRFPKRKVRPKKYYEKGISRRKAMEEVSSELNDEDRKEICEIIMNSFNLQGEDQEGEGGTRSDAAEEFWENNWHNMYPKDGKGKFVYQYHWRGLTEDESKFDNKKLLGTDNSLHGDLRFEKDKDELFGFTVFLGEAKDNKEEGKLIEQIKDKGSKSKLQGAFKLAQPHSWLDVGKGSGTISEPGDVASTSKKWAKFFKIDGGKYEIGVWRKHYFEIFLYGDKLKGRMNIQYAPIGEDGRKWLVNFPKDQTPYAKANSLDKVIKELKKKKQKYLIWSKPGEKPKKIEVKKWKTK